MLTRLLSVAVLVVLAGCATTPVSRATAGYQARAIAQAREALASLEDPNAAVSIRADLVRSLVARGLEEARLSREDALDLHDLAIQPELQGLSIDAGVTYTARDGRTHAGGRVRGHVTFSVIGSDLLWYPSIDRVELKELTVGGVGLDALSEAAAALANALREQLNARIATALSRSDTQRIPLALEPFDHIDLTSAVGEAQPGMTFASRIPVKGIVNVRASVIDISPDAVVVLARLEYTPAVRECADVLTGDDAPGVSRALFSSGVEAHEPTDELVRAGADQSLAFFTEVVGARGATVEHRWLQDGEESDRIPLRVEGDRFRTYSRKARFRAAVTQIIEAQAILKRPEGECLLARRFLRRGPPVEPVVPPPPEPAALEVMHRQFEEEFSRRLAQVASDPPQGKAWAALSRPFVASVLNGGLVDPELIVRYDPTALGTFHFGGDVPALDPEKLRCGDYSCAPDRDCKPDRDCGDDTRCRGNEFKRMECRARKAARKFDCERLRYTAERTCLLEREFEKQTCRLGRQAVTEACRVARQAARLLRTDKIAHVSGSGTAKGELALGITGARVLPSLDRLDLDLVTAADVTVSADVRWTPANLAGHWACLTSWQRKVTARAVHRLTTHALQLPLVYEEGEGGPALITTVPEVKLKIEATPPIEAVFLAHPELLAICGNGVSVASLVEVLKDGGPDPFLKGELSYTVRASRQRIRLAEVRVRLGGEELRLQPRLVGDALVFATR